MYVCMYVSVYVYEAYELHVCMYIHNLRGLWHVHTCVYVFMHVAMYTYMHVAMYTCMHVCM